MQTYLDPSVNLTLIALTISNHNWISICNNLIMCEVHIHVHGTDELRY